MPSAFITTPIFYVNSSPHIGHLYTALIADAFARWRKLINPTETVILSTGTDEHGSKIAKAAEARGLSTLKLCNKISHEFREIFGLANVRFSAFVRTSDLNHIKTVQTAWHSLKAQGLIENGSYAGWYSVVDESFYKDSQVVSKSKDGANFVISSETGNICEWISENNYMINISKFKDEINNWISHESIFPHSYVPVLKLQLESLNEFSLSRPSSRCPWGIPVPHDPSQMIYVWFDALLSYLTAVGYPGKLSHWPPTYQIVGKDIIKFHAILWPAILLALGMELPKKLICHGHWLVENKKMSKSLGNSINPRILMTKYSVDGIRYSMLRCGVVESDNNFSEEKFISVLNSELSNTLGNLLSRCCPLYQHDVMYSGDNEYSVVDTKIESLHKNIAQDVASCFNDFDFCHGIIHIMDYLRYVNKFFHQYAPWKNVDDQERLKYILYNVLESLRKSGILLQPIIPDISSTLLDKLGIPVDQRNYECAKRPHNFKRPIDFTGSVFQRIKC